MLKNMTKQMYYLIYHKDGALKIEECTLEQVKEKVGTFWGMQEYTKWLQPPFKVDRTEEHGLCGLNIKELPLGKQKGETYITAAGFADTFEDFELINSVMIIKGRVVTPIKHGDLWKTKHKKIKLTDKEYRKAVKHWESIPFQKKHLPKPRKYKYIEVLDKFIDKEYGKAMKKAKGSKKKRKSTIFNY